MKTTLIKTTNLQLEFCEDLTIKDIKYKDEKLIDEIKISDHAYKQLDVLKDNYPYIDHVADVLKNIKFDFKYEAKKKSTLVFINGKLELYKNTLNINLILDVTENEIKIISRNIAKKKTIYGLTFEIKNSKNTTKIPPHFLEGNTGILSLNYDDEVLIRNNNTVKIMSTFSRVNFLKDKLIISPLIDDTFRKIYKFWNVKNNNKNYNVLLMKFS